MAGPDPHKPSPLDKLVPLHSQEQTSIIECIYHFIKKPVLKRTYRMMWQFSTGTRCSWFFHTDGQPLWRMHSWCICLFRGRKCFPHRVGCSNASWRSDSPKCRKRRVCISTGEPQSGIIADNSFIKNNSHKVFLLIKHQQMYTVKINVPDLQRRQDLGFGTCHQEARCQLLPVAC